MPHSLSPCLLFIDQEAEKSRPVACKAKDGGRRFDGGGVYFGVFPKDYGKEIRTEFWTEFGKRMQRHRSARGPKVKWVNYLTGIKDLYFRLHADQEGVGISIDIQHRDPDLREVFYDQWWELETMLHTKTGHPWTWTREYHLPTGESIARIYHTQGGLNLYEKADWKAMFAFFEWHILALDEIWGDAYDIFKDLQD